jgi:hypothetical protein
VYYPLVGLLSDDMYCGVVVGPKLYERIEEWKVLFIGMILLCFEVTLEKGN